MQPSAANRSERPGPRPRPRRRRRGLALTFVALVLVLIGHGLGWFGSAASPQRGAGNGDARGSAPGEPAQRGAQGPVDDSPAAGRSGQAPGPVVGDGGGAVPGLTAGPGTARRGSAKADGPDPINTDAPHTGSAGTPATTSEPPSPVPPPTDGLAPDRFGSLLSLVRAHVRDGALAKAQAAAQRLGKLPLSDAQRRRFAELLADIGDATRAAEAEVLSLVQRGELLRAERAATTLWPERAVVGEVLGAVAGGLALPDDWRATPRSSDVPAPRPLARGRAVRVWWRDAISTGSVVRDTGERVTVQVRSARGQSFPTVPRVCCEPVDADAQEAVDQGLVAVLAGRPLLARLWLLRAWQASQQALDERGQLLLRCLQ